MKTEICGIKGEWKHIRGLDFKTIRKILTQVIRWLNKLSTIVGSLQLLHSKVLETSCFTLKIFDWISFHRINSKSQKLNCSLDFVDKSQQRFNYKTGFSSSLNVCFHTNNLYMKCCRSCISKSSPILTLLNYPL